MSLKKMKHLVLATGLIALLAPTAQAASTITIAASPTVAAAVNDMINDFIGVTDSLPNATGGIGLGYSIALQVISDAEAAANIIAANQPGGDLTQLPDLFLSQSVVAPNDLILKGLTLDGELIKFAKDSLVLYSSGEKQANITATIDPNGHLDLNKLVKIKVAAPDWTTNDPYGSSVKKILGSSLIQQLKKKNKLVLTPDAVSSYAAVEIVDLADGGADWGFTGLSQICAVSDGVQAFEPGSKHFTFSARFDVQLAGVKIANNFNTTSSPTYSPAQEQELRDFVDFLTGTPLGGVPYTGQDTLAQRCFK
jgi:molybdate transport system substrate-binding protein